MSVAAPYLPLPPVRPPAPSAAQSDSNGSAHSGNGAPPDPDLHYSILVHNVTHSDLLFGLAPNELNPVSSTQQSPSQPHSSSLSFASLHSASLIAQPRFHRYRDLTRAVLKQFAVQQRKQPVYFPSLHYNQGEATLTPSSTRQHSPTLTRAVSSPLAPQPAAPPGSLPYGFQLSPTLPTFDSYDGLRLRSSFSAPDAKLPELPRVLAVFFPLLAVIVPKWLLACEKRRLKRDKIREVMQSSSATSSSPARSNASASSTIHSERCVLYLVSGAGTPWDQSLSTTANSTKCTAQFLQLFLSHFYPSIQVQVVHSSQDIFHFDHNVRFINTELMPLLLSHRSYLSSLFADQWPSHLSLFSSLTDSPPARSSSLLTSLRPLRPSTLHMWQLKSFWCEYPAVTGRGEEDVEEVTFDKVEMTPPQRVDELLREDDVRLLVRRMEAYRDEFLQQRDGESSNEMNAFWMRKSKKPVLSMLMVHKHGQERKYYRGLNMEVSMPTGSLCSERSAIASALSDDVGLCRRDLKMIAVLALPLDRKARVSAADSEAEKRKEEELLKEIKLLESTSPLISAVQHTSPRQPVSPLNLRHGSMHDDDEEEEQNEEKEQRTRQRDAKRRRLTTDLTVSCERSDSSSSTSLASLLTSPATSTFSSSALDSSPSFLPSPAAMRSSLRKQQQLEAELLLMHIRRAQHTGDDEGRNPINPCGACNEWLKKIAEVQPDFKVITFTSTDCSTVFVKGVKD